jgi:4-diphosphocytidyl-2-C-methyl-D-erythritol kinase
VIVFPNGKINLGLNIVEKRADGYHNLETLFYPIASSDVLGITHSTSYEFKAFGLPIDGSDENNLCTKAYWLLKSKFPRLPPVKTSLYKNIPMGAGLGGGSADGAFTLRLLNDLFQLDISKELLLQYALLLGSDCPFFLLNTPCLASGRGEFLEPIKFTLQNFLIVLISPGISVSTSWAYSQITPVLSANPIRDIITQPVENWRNLLANDFEIPVFSKFPRLKEIKEKLYESGAVYGSLSGSGSALYGLFSKNNFQREKIINLLSVYGQVTISN